MNELEQMMRIPEDKNVFFNTWQHLLTKGFLWDKFMLYVNELTQGYKIEIIGTGDKQVIKIKKNQYDSHWLLTKTMSYEVKVIDYLETLSKFILSAGEKSFSDLYKDNDELIDIIPPMSFIQYAIIETFNRDFEYVETKEQTNTPKKTKRSNKAPQSKEYTLFDAIKVYRKKANTEKRKYTRHSTGWDVRGKLRHYKSGKVGWVRPYSTGDKRTKQSKEYKLKSNE